MYRMQKRASKPRFKYFVFCNFTDRKCIHPDLDNEEKKNSRSSFKNVMCKKRKMFTCTSISILASAV